MVKFMAGKEGNKPLAGILEFKLVHPRSVKASTYFIRYASSSRGSHANSRGRQTPQVGKPVSPKAQTRTSKIDPNKLPGRARFQSGQRREVCIGFSA